MDIVLRADGPGVCRLQLEVLSRPGILTAQTMEDYMEVMLARLDAIRRRGADAMPQLRETFTAASQTLQVRHTSRLCTVLTCNDSSL